MKVEELRTEGRVYRRCFSRLGTAVVGRANADGTTTAVRKMRCRSGLHVPRAQGARGGQGLACVEGHRGRVCFPCGGGLQGWDARRWVRFCDIGVFWPRGVFSARWFTRLGCAALGKVLRCRCFLAAGCVFSWEVYKVGMRGSRGKSRQAGRNLCAGSGEIPKTLEKAVEGIALRGGFGLGTEGTVGGKGGGVHCRRGFMSE